MHEWDCPALHFATLYWPRMAKWSIGVYTIIFNPREEFLGENVAQDFDELASNTINTYLLPWVQSSSVYKVEWHKFEMIEH